MNSDNKTPPAPVSIPLEERVQGLLLQLPHYRNSQILKVDCLVGDASARQYYRIWLKQSPVESMIAMIVNQNPGPVGGGPKQLGQDQTFVEMAHFFRQHTIPVPQVLLHAESANIILVEDVGRFSVRDYLEGDPNRIGDAYGTVASGSELLQQTDRRSTT
jgi:aminoglycoside/choline kinase family phosphotransferase